MQLNNRHLFGAKVFHRLRHLNAYDSATDDQHALRDLSYRGDVAVVPRLAAFDARNWWHQRNTSGGDNDRHVRFKLARYAFFIGDGNLFGTGKSGVTSR